LTTFGWWWGRGRLETETTDEVKRRWASKGVSRMKSDRAIRFVVSALLTALCMGAVAWGQPAETVGKRPTCVSEGYTIEIPEVQRVERFTEAPRHLLRIPLRVTGGQSRFRIEPFDAPPECTDQDGNPLKGAGPNGGSTDGKRTWASDPIAHPDGPQVAVVETVWEDGARRVGHLKGALRISGAAETYRAEFRPPFEPGKSKWSRDAVEVELTTLEVVKAGDVSLASLVLTVKRPRPAGEQAAEKPRVVNLFYKLQIEYAGGSMTGSSGNIGMGIGPGQRPPTAIPIRHQFQLPGGLDKVELISLEFPGPETTKVVPFEFRGLPVPGE
jgi:hypothetical protein